MKKLRILFPGCPVEQALDTRIKNTEHIRAGLADMVEAVTTMRVPAECDRREHSAPVPIDRRKMAAR